MENRVEIPGWKGPSVAFSLVVAGNETSRDLGERILCLHLNSCDSKQHVNGMLKRKIANRERSRRGF